MPLTELKIQETYLSTKGSKVAVGAADQALKKEPLSPLNQAPVDSTVATELGWVLLAAPATPLGNCRTLADIWAADVLTRS